MQLTRQDLIAEFRYRVRIGAIDKKYAFMAYRIGWTSDWMRLFPGYTPHWNTWYVWRDIMDEHIKKNAAGYRVGWSPEHRDKELDAKIRALGGDLPFGDWYLNDSAPPPGGLYKLVREIEKWAPLDYKDTSLPAVSFKPITHPLKLNLSGAKDYIRIDVTFGKVKPYRQLKGANKLVVHVSDAGGVKGSFYKKLYSAAEVKKYMKSLLGGPRKYADQVMIISQVDRYEREAEPAIYSEDSAYWVNKHLCPSHIMDKPKWGALWEAYRYADREGDKRSPGYRMILLVGGLFWLFTGTVVHIGVTFWERENRAHRVKHQRWVAFESHPGLKKKDFRKTLEPFVENCLKTIASDWELISHHSGRRDREYMISHVPGLSVDQVFKKLQANLHTRALEIFKPEAPKCQ